MSTNTSCYHFPQMSCDVIVILQEEKAVEALSGQCQQTWQCNPSAQLSSLSLKKTKQKTEERERKNVWQLITGIKKSGMHLYNVLFCSQWVNFPWDVGKQPIRGKDMIKWMTPLLPLTISLFCLS